MRILFLSLLAFFPALVFANPYTGDKTCTPTPGIKNIMHYPGRSLIVSSNNLALPEGKSVYAGGQRLFIFGRVLDKDCVPVPDAIVEIWQTNTDGVYTLPLMMELMSPYPYFTGSGRAITDNLGQFSFITLFPGPENEKRAPHIKIHVTLHDFPVLDTEMYFADDRRNLEDRVLNKFPVSARDLLLAKVTPLDDPPGALMVKWKLVLNGVSKFRKF